MYSGIKAYEVGKGKPKQTKEIRESKPYTSESKLGKDWMPFYEGKHITSYNLNWDNNSYIYYGEWLAAPRDAEQFLDEKILIRKIIGSRLIATYIPFTSYCNTLLFILKLKDPFVIGYKELLGILNSRLIAWYFRHKFQISGDDTFPQIMIRDILKFPITLPIESSKIKLKVSSLLDTNTKFFVCINKFSKYLKSFLSTHNLGRKLENWHELDFGDFIKELNKAIKVNNKLRVKDDLEAMPELTKKDEFEWLDLFEDNKTKAQDLQTQINQIEQEIDAIVYELYGLTEDEIAIVENG
ncbi:TaqI-like C-terminal specificity domain-containing protein [Formosa algae]